MSGHATQAPAPITRADLMSWAKVAAIVLPILVAVVSAAWKLSSDASDIQHDLGTLKQTVQRHEEVLASYTDVAPALRRTVEQLGGMAAKVDGWSVEQTRLIERQTAQDQRTAQFWAITWPSMEARLKRIEDKLDRGR